MQVPPPLQHAAEHSFDAQGAARLYTSQELEKDIESAKICTIHIDQLV